MTVDAAYAGRLRQLMGEPQARAPSTLGEIWGAEWAASGLDTLETTADPFRGAYDDLVKRVQERKGRGVAALAEEFGVDLGQTRGMGDQITGINRLIDRLPEEDRVHLEPYRDVVANARTRARDTERRAAETAASTYGLSGYATGFAAGVARQMVSPVNLALMPLGGPLRGPVGRMLLREAGYGALGQAVQEPAISAGREQLGLESSSIENIAQAALGQAAFAGVFRAGAAGLRLWREAEALRAEGLTRETAPIARAIEGDIASWTPPAAPGLDPAGRLTVDAAPRMTLELPEGVTLQSRQPGAAAAAQPPAEWRAEASAVTFDAPTLSAPQLSAPMREVAGRLDPEDIEAVALLAERDAVLDAQAGVLGTVRDQVEAAMQRVNAPREARDLVTGERLPEVVELDRRVAEAERALDDLRADPLALDADLRAVAARKAEAEEELAGLTGRRRASPRAGELRALVAEAGEILEEAAALREGEARRALAQIRMERARAGVALNEALTAAGVRDLSAESLTLLQAEAVDQAARALEAGRPVAQPAAFRASPEVRFSGFEPRSAFDLQARQRPEIAEAADAAARALDEGRAPEGPLARAFYADDAMTVPVPREIALDRIARAAERAASAEAAGAARWSLEGVGALAARIDRPASSLPAVKDRPPRADQPVRVRAKAEEPPAVSSRAAGGSDADPAARLEAQVLRGLEAAGGDHRISVTLPDGRTVQSARELMARIADDGRAVAEFDACMRGAP